MLQFIIYQSSTSVRSFFLLWSRSSIKRWISSYLTFLYLTFLFIIFRFWKMVLLDRVFRLGIRYKYPLKLILGFIYGAKACNTMNVSTPCLSIECILRQYLWISGNIGEYPTRKIVICGMHRILHMYEFFLRKSMRMGSLSADPISYGIFPDVSSMDLDMLQICQFEYICSTSISFLCFREFVLFNKITIRKILLMETCFRMLL